MLSSQAVTADATPPYLPAGASVYSGQAWADQATQVGWVVRVCGGARGGWGGGWGGGGGGGGVLQVEVAAGDAAWRQWPCRRCTCSLALLLQSGTSALEASWDPFVDDETGVQWYSYQVLRARHHCTALLYPALSS